LLDALLTAIVIGGKRLRWRLPVKAHETLHLVPRR